jgi:hypothetical protein
MLLHCCTNAAAAVLLLLPGLQGVSPALRTFNTLVIACNVCNQPREALAGTAQCFCCMGLSSCCSIDSSGFLQLIVVAGCL